jgi:hypothetical protein
VKITVRVHLRGRSARGVGKLLDRQAFELQRLTAYVKASNLLTSNACAAPAPTANPMAQSVIEAMPIRVLMRSSRRFFLRCVHLMFNQLDHS